MTDDLTTTLGRYIATEILKDPGRRLAVDEPLISSGLVDSFSLVDLAIFVETQFGVRIHDTELSAQVFDNLNALAQLIRQRMPGPAA
jgi:acyl carrier protein